MGWARAAGQPSERSSACCARNHSRTDFDHLLDTAFEKIRHYAVNDIAVSLRLLRALADLATTTDDERTREQLVLRGRRIVAGCATRVDASDFKRLESRLAELEAHTPATTLNRVDGAQAK